jgi:hypothetical protein
VTRGAYVKSVKECEEEEEFIQNREEGESHLFILKRSCFVNYMRILFFRATGHHTRVLERGVHL